MLSKKNTINVLSNFKKVIFLNLFFSSILLSAQGFQDYGLGGGLKVQSRDYNYGFQLGGAIQPRILFSSNSGERKFDGLIILTDMEAPKPVSSKAQRMWMTTPECKERSYFQTNERVIAID